MVNLDKKWYSLELTIFLNVQKDLNRWRWDSVLWNCQGSQFSGPVAGELDVLTIEKAGSSVEAVESPIQVLEDSEGEIQKPSSTYPLKLWIIWKCRKSVRFGSQVIHRIVVLPSRRRGAGNAPDEDVVLLKLTDERSDVPVVIGVPFDKEDDISFAKRDWGVVEETLKL